MNEKITGSSNKKIRYIEKLLRNRRFRHSEKRFAAEGIKITREAVSAGKARAVFVSDSCECHEFDGLSITSSVSDNIFKKISETVNTQGVISVCTMPEYHSVEMMKKKNALFIALDGINDPGNLGTIVRTGLGAGADCIIMSSETVDLFNPKVVRATMGAVFRQPFFYTDDLPGVLRSFREQGGNVYASFPASGNEYYKKDYTGSVCIVIGNEANGISSDVKETGPEPVNIPMNGGLESLNAAVSAAVIMYEARRQRDCR